MYSSEAPTKQIQEWVEQVRSGETRAISRAISAVENGEPEAEEILRQLFSHTGRGFLIGVTGSPGAGKSSLVDRLAAAYRKQGKRVGIIAVDPSSPFTGGAILGDRIRMQGHATDAGIYIRSMATRGYLGGLARASADVALILEAAGKDVILIETVGVGQDEVEIVKLADCTLVLVVPGMGDDVQTLKAGLMEIGDIFVINKADLPNASRLEQQLKAMLSFAGARDGWTPAVLQTVATENKGVDELAAAIDGYRSHFASQTRRDSRQRERWRQRLIEMTRERLVTRVLEQEIGEKRLLEYAEAVARRERDPYSILDEILRRVGLS
jgi:LAO/AO transport system kinase